jgi:PPOX class probable F420-dependent enzyme
LSPQQVDVPMQISEAMGFVAERKNAMLLAIKSDGRPQSSNIAYVVNDAGQILISVTEGRAKTKNLRRDPRASLHVNRDDFWAYVVVEANVELTPVAASPDDDTVDRLVEYYRAVAGEHDNWDEYRQAMVDDQRLILTLTPTHAYGMLQR